MRSRTTRSADFASPLNRQSCSARTSPTGIPSSGQNPEAFDPERFLPAVAKTRPRYAYFPFGGGPRLCMGADMAVMETLLIMAMVVQRFRLHLVSCHREEPECIIDMVPRGGVPATLERQPRTA